MPQLGGTDHEGGESADEIIYRILRHYLEIGRYHDAILKGSFRSRWEAQTRLFEMQYSPVAAQQIVDIFTQNRIPLDRSGYRYGGSLVSH